jgi:hypothetical protein
VLEDIDITLTIEIQVEAMLIPLYVLNQGSHLQVEHASAKKHLSFPVRVYQCIGSTGNGPELCPIDSPPEQL